MAKKRRAKPDDPAERPLARPAAPDQAPAGYADLLAAIKQRVQTAQVRAAVAVNRELVLLYWQIGRDILRRQREEGWGARVIDRLAADLHAAFPGMKGFSTRNLKYMRALAEAYPDEAFVQEALAQITWYHAITLLDKVAVSDADEDFARRLRRGTGADRGASGATRVSGSLNFKEKYAPNYPTVETVRACPGKVVTRAELEDLGVVAPIETVMPVEVHAHRTGRKGWPNYQRCVENAPPARSGDHPDISRADFTFCLLAIDWGWSAEDAASRLMQESGKAQAEGEKYAMRTARAAARAVEGRGGECGRAKGRPFWSRTYTVTDGDGCAKAGRGYQMAHSQQGQAREQLDIRSRRLYPPLPREQIEAAQLHLIDPNDSRNRYTFLESCFLPRPLMLRARMSLR